MKQNSKFSHQKRLYGTRRIKIKQLVLSSLVIACLCSCADDVTIIDDLYNVQAGDRPAFAGASGGGATTPGGRGGRLIEVTTLADDIPAPQGSFRAAVEAEGPRIVVFRVSGIITLKQQIVLTEKHSYLTVAGQTAPAGGILLRIDPGIHIEANERLSMVMAIWNGGHDIVIRYLKLRRGSLPFVSKNEDNGNAAMQIINGENHHIVIDHCSLSWSDNAVLNVHGPENHHITLQYNLIAESFDPHFMGSNIGSDTAPTKSVDIDVHHNMFSQCSHMLPHFAALRGRLINNLVYNWQWRGIGVDLGSEVDIIGYRFKQGSRNQDRPEVYVRWTSDASKEPSIYVANNIGPNAPEANDDDWKMVRLWQSPVSEEDYITVAPRKWQRQTPLPKTHFPIPVHEVQKLEPILLDDVGASHRLDEHGQFVPNRSAVDARMIKDYQNGTGDYMISGHEKWPSIVSGSPYPDQDHDGMSDIWEEENFESLKTARYDEQYKTDYDQDGYSDLEEFLNGTDPLQ